MHTKLYSYALKTAKQSDLPEKPLGLLQIALLSIHVRKIEVNSGPLLLLRLKHSTTNKQPIRSKRTRSASILLQNRSSLSPTRPTRNTKRPARCTAEDPTSQSKYIDSIPIPHFLPWVQLATHRLISPSFYTHKPNEIEPNNSPDSASTRTKTP